METLSCEFGEFKNDREVSTLKVQPKPAGFVNEDVSLLLRNTN